MNWLKTTLLVLIGIVVIAGAFAVLAAPDTVTGQANISWTVNNPDSAYSDCYIRIYGEYHSNFPGLDGPLQFKIVNPRSTNKTKYAIIPYSKIPAGVYYVNLECELPGGLKNESYCRDVHPSRPCDISKWLDTKVLFLGIPEDMSRVYAYIGPQTDTWRSICKGQTWSQYVGTAVNTSKDKVSAT